MAQEDQRLPEPAAAARIALIVGINQYSESEDGASLPALRGCANDVDAAARLLIDRFHFRPEDLKILVDDEATHEGIVRAFREHLIERAGPDTEAVFWFSGHGSRAEDLSGIPGEETGGKDSTLVAWDSRTAGFDLSDDELYSLLQALCERTSRVTAIIDSCYSGGATRGPASTSARYAVPATRAVRFRDLAAFWPSDVPFLEDGHPERREELPVVTISACAYDQQAEEMRIRGGRDRWHWYGAMSYHLVAAMARMEPGTSFEMLTRDTALRVSNRFRDQHVQADGPTNRVAFSGGFAGALPGFPGLAVAGSQGVEVEAGAFHLLAPGAVLEVRDLPGRPLGRVRVKEVEPYQSWATWLEEPEDLGDLVPVRLVLLRAPTGDPVRLAVDPVVLAPRVSAAWGPDDDFPAQIVGNDDRTADFLLRQGARKEWSLLALPEEHHLWTSAPGLDPAMLAREAGAALAAELRYRRLMEFAGAGGGIRLSMTVGVPEREALQKRRFAGGKPAQPAGARWPAARSSANGVVGVPTMVDQAGVMDLMELTVVLDGAEEGDPVHLSILCLSADRTISLVYPPPSRRHEGMLEPGIPKTVQVEIFLNPGWNEEAPLRDRYLAIATFGITDFSALQTGTPVATGGQVLAQSQLRGRTQPFPPLLLEAMQAKTLRGGPLQDADDWRFGVAAADVLVIRGSED